MSWKVILTNYEAIVANIMILKKKNYLILRYYVEIVNNINLG